MLSTMSNMAERLNAALEGRYAIERELGEGGMATVYLADDLKHERKVALKVLKPELAAVVGAERFLAEIKTTANLQHPHILPLHDSGEADSFLFYVMPYVEGETLRDRIDREKQLPVDEAVALASKVAGALQHAHEHGVIHRDIKPGNILLQDGEPVVADFGIALAVGAAGSNRLTETGLSLGTPYYMSPEQATGDQAVGASTDTYALGSVLYEMLTGDPPYMGSTAQAVLGQIISAKPISATEKRPSIPANVDAAVRKALEKLPADRFGSAQEFVKALEDEHFRYGERVAAGAVGAAAGPWNRLTLVGWSLAAVTTLIAGGLLLRPAAPNPVTRVSVQIPEDQFFDPVRGYLDLSDDGSLLVYRGVGVEGQAQLWARRWNALNATPIGGTDGGALPAISPDGQEVAFQVGGSIRVVPLQGGVSRTLAERGLCCAGWSSDGAWVYYSEPNAGLRRVPAGGGSPEIVTEVDTGAGDAVNMFLDVLPDGRGVVFMTRGPDGHRIQAVDGETGEVKDLTPGTFPRYSPTGHLLFVDDDGTLLAAPFDVERLELTGAAVPVAEGLTVLFEGDAFFAVSQTGTLVYRTGGIPGGLVTPVWVERDGTARDIEAEWTVAAVSGNTSLALSADGARLAMSIGDQENTYDLWVKQLDTGPLSRVTFEGTNNRRAVWSPDGQSLTFVSNRAGQSDLWTKPADGTGAAEVVLDRELTLHEVLYSPDGTWLVFREETGTDVDDDIYAIRPGVDSVAFALAATEFSERSPALSPDGRWLAYISNQSGRQEVYVRPFPPDAGSDLVQVSADGGTEPIWAHSGRELFYRNGSNELVAVQVSGDPSFSASQQEVLFSTADYMRGGGHAIYDVTPDDQRFVMLRIREVDSGTLILVQNFFEELRERIGN